MFVLKLNKYEEFSRTWICASLPWPPNSSGWKLKLRNFKGKELRRLSAAALSPHPPPPPLRPPASRIKTFTIDPPSYLRSAANRHIWFWFWRYTRPARRAHWTRTSRGALIRGNRASNAEVMRSVCLAILRVKRRRHAVRLSGDTARQTQTSRGALVWWYRASNADVTRSVSLAIPRVKCRRHAALWSG